MNYIERNVVLSHGTYRIYDDELVKKLKKLSTCRSGSKNQFIIELIELGAECLLGNKTEPTVGIDLSDIHSELKGINKLVTEDTLSFLEQMDDIMYELNVLQKLLASTYNMVLFTMKGQAVSDEFIEKGLLDDMPKRFKVK